MAARLFPRRRNSTRYRQEIEEDCTKKEHETIYHCVMIDNGHGRNCPAPRSGHRIVADDANIYSFGGYNPRDSNSHNGLYKELWRFNLANKRWYLMEKGHSCPEETASHSMIVLGTSLLIWGGTGFPFGEKCSNTLHVYHLPSSKWHTVACGGDTPTPRYGHSMNYKDGNVFVIGGTTGFNYIMNVHRLNLETMHWTDISPPPPTIYHEDGDATPEPRYRHEVVSSGNWMYVLGGGTALDVFNFKTVPAYNVQTKKWANMTSKPCLRTNAYPPPRKFHAAVQHANFAYICGGFDGHVCMFADIWRLDLSDLQWTHMWQTLPMPVYFHTATTTPSGCLFVFGGVVTKDGQDRTNKVFKMWLTIPSLQDIVWESICDKNPSLLTNLQSQEKRDKWNNLGVYLPRKFYKRLD